MNITPIIRKLIPIALVLVAVLPVGAQDEADASHPLLELLAFVPDTEAARSELYYADIRTSAETVLGETQDSSQEAWEALGYPDMWVGWIPDALPPFRVNLMTMIDDSGQSTGIDVTTVERTVFFGQPPATGLILQGDFDDEAIVAAFTAETHELQPRDDVTLMCSVDGCDDGLATNPAQRNLANPFGGQLGRREPIALLDGLIFNSADIATVEAMLSAWDGNALSLADSPDYQAAVLVAAERGMMRQAAFFASETPAFGDVETFIAVSPLTQAQRDELLDRLTPLPLYSLVMLAETADLDSRTQAGHVLLVYDDEANARVAIEAMQANLQPDGFISQRARRPFYDLMTERGEMTFQVVAHEDTGRYVVLFSLQAPLVQLPQPDETTPTFSGLQFRLFLDMVISRDTVWLAYEIEGE